MRTDAYHHLAINKVIIHFKSRKNYWMKLWDVYEGCREGLNNYLIGPFEAGPSSALISEMAYFNGQDFGG